MKSALQANKQRPVHIWRIVPAIFDRDPGCVLHGVFLEEIDGRIRLPRLVSAYIEACSPNQANSGGVYRGEVTAKDNIPYSRQEFTSSGIAASFIFHMSTLKGYGPGGLQTQIRPSIFRPRVGFQAMLSAVARKGTLASERKMRSVEVAAVVSRASHSERPGRLVQ